MSELCAPDALDIRPRAASRAEALLRAGIPLSLLLDLASGDPRSDEICAWERAS